MNGLGLYPFHLGPHHHQGNADRVILPLTSPSALNCIGKEGYNALHAAVKTMDLYVIDYVLEHVHEPVFYCWWTDMIPLTLAIELMNEDTVLELIPRFLQQGGFRQILAKDGDCYSRQAPFFVAMESEMLQVLEYFLNVLPEPIPPKLLSKELGRNYKFIDDDQHKAQLLLLLMRHQVIPESDVEILADENVRQRMNLMRDLKQKKSAQSQLGKRSRDEADLQSKPDSQAHSHS